MSICKGVRSVWPQAGKWLTLWNKNKHTVCTESQRWKAKIEFGECLDFEVHGHVPEHCL